MASYFNPEFFEFLQQLKRNNRREWFAKNKSRFESVVRDPCLRFITEAADPLHNISAQIVADPRPNVGIQFRHAAEKKDVHAPGFYFHLEPGQYFLAAGSWRPESKQLNNIRQAIVAKPERWKKATSKLTLDGEVLSRPPRGFAADHPLIGDLKRKDFIALVEFSEAQVCGPKFMKDFTKACQQISPLVEFLSQALGFRY